MQRIAGTDVWQEMDDQLNANWRGSYCFIPTERDDIFLHHPPIASVREGWRKLLPQAIADPLNPQSWKGGRGHAVSALEMPQAPLQPGWDCPQAPEIAAKEIIWKSERLKNSRRVWIFTTRRCNSRRTSAGSFARWRILGAKYARLACADFADPSSATSSRRVCVDRRCYRHHAPRTAV